MEIYLDFSLLSELERNHREDPIFLDTLNTFIDLFMNQGSFIDDHAFIKSKDSFIFNSLRELGVIKNIRDSHNIDDKKTMLKS